MKLAGREKGMLSLMVTCVLLVAVYEIGSPYWDKYDSLKKSIPKKQAQLQEVRQMKHEHEELQAKLFKLEKRVQERGQVFDLYSFVNSVASELELKPKLTTLRGSPLDTKRFSDISVKMELEGASMKELNDLLYKLYASEKLIVVNVLRVYPNQGPKGGISAEIQIQTLLAK